MSCGWRARAGSVEEEEEASLLLILSLCCVLKRELVNGVIVCGAGREGGSCRAWLCRELMCVFESVCVSVC